MLFIPQGVDNYDEHRGQLDIHVDVDFSTDDVFADLADDVSTADVDPGQHGSAIQLYVSGNHDDGECVRAARDGNVRARDRCDGDPERGAELERESGDARMRGT